MVRNKTIMLRLTTKEKSLLEEYAKLKFIPTAVLIRQTMLQIVNSEIK